MLTWKIQEHKYGSPEHRLISRKVPVGVASYNPHRSKGDGPETSYRWQLTVPGNERKGFAPTLEEAKSQAELAFAGWCQAAGLRRA